LTEDRPEGTTGQEKGAKRQLFRYHGWCSEPNETPTESKSELSMKKGPTVHDSSRQEEVMRTEREGMLDLVLGGGG